MYVIISTMGTEQNGPDVVEELESSSQTSGEVENDSSCTHHWVIDSPNGATSKGLCKVCGIEREFRNSYEYSSWQGLKSAQYVRKKASQ